MRKRGSVWLANLNPGRGAEPGKIRPVLIVQSQALLDAEHPSTLIIMPLTTRLADDAEPLRLRIPAQGRLMKDSDERCRRRIADLPAIACVRETQAAITLTCPCLPYLRIRLSRVTMTAFFRRAVATRKRSAGSA